MTSELRINLSKERSRSVRATVVASVNQVSCDLAGEAAILNLSAGVYYTLDPVGSRIWELIHEPITISALRDRLMEEYEVTPQQCEEDLFTLLERLADEGLVEITDAPAD